MTAEMIIKKANALDALKKEVEERNAAAKAAFYEQPAADIISNRLEIVSAKFDEETQRAEIVTGYRYADITKVAKKSGCGDTVKAYLKKLDTLIRDNTAKEYSGATVSNVKVVDILQGIYNALDVKTRDKDGATVAAKATAAHARYIKNGMTRNTRNAGETAASGAKNQVAMLIYAVTNCIDLRVKYPAEKVKTTNNEPQTLPLTREPAAPVEDIPTV